MKIFVQFAAVLVFAAAMSCCDSSKNANKNEPPQGNQSVPKFEEKPTQTKDETGGIIRKDTPPKNDQNIPKPQNPTPPPGEKPVPVPTPKTNVGKDCFDPAKANDRLMCPDLFDPVCGCDGIDYSNSCEAKKKGVLKWEKGPCKH